MPERRENTRVQVELACTLRRARGSLIDVRTVDLGPGGMCVTSPRPLATDETFGFAVAELAGGPGEARVLRQQSTARYALRFERVPDALRRQLEALVTGAPEARRGSRPQEKGSRTRTVP